MMRQVFFCCTCFDGLCAGVLPRDFAYIFFQRPVGKHFELSYYTLSRNTDGHGNNDNK